VLYTIDKAAKQFAPPEKAVIVEGYMDALRAHQDGFGNVVASLGTAITGGQLTLLSRQRNRDAAPLRTVLALDADPAGARAAAEAGVRAVVAMHQPQTRGTAGGRKSTASAARAAHTPPFLRATIRTN